MATDLSQYGGEGYVPTPGFDPLGRGGDRYGVISGPPLPFENEPAPISQTPNLGVLPELLGIYNPPPAQPISDLERIAYAAPEPVRFTAQQPTVFGPVTASGYAQPPVDPMSYYQPVAQPVPQAPANPNASTRWTDFSSIKPSTYDVSPMSETPAPPSQTPAFTPAVTAPGQVYGRIGDPVPGQPGVRVGDPIPPDNEGNQWVWDLTVPGLGYFVPPKPTTPPEPPKVDEIPPEQVTETVGTQTPTTSTPTVTPGTNTPPPGTEIKEEVSQYVPARVIIDPIKYDPFPISEFQFTEPAPVTPINRQPGRLIPTLKPVDIELPMRRAVERLAPGIFRDINYDPELILEAAMRSLGPRYAKQSVIDEQRMFERMMR